TEVAGQTDLADQKTQLIMSPKPQKRLDGFTLLLIALALVVGIALGAGGVLSYFLSISGDRQVQPPPAAAVTGNSGAIVVQASSTYITQLIRKNIASSGLPGDVKNVQVKLVHKGPITVTGDDQLSFLGVNITRHFSLQVQPVVNDCQLEVHVVHADLEGIAVTGFASTFEGQINQQLHVDTSNFPNGFKYCLTDVHTEPQGLFATYSATPV
ncbi:MAG TPA: hypothetical protein VFU49_07140, partial [Ktedonobacteraceae bacterium]|nr:hypothetical protein [Ktedonobacteraceae bacterium]